ncbi:MAG: type I DNA topoisomerase, partial [bacterium]|nr:type I DNA topoisomerase [bacterium]
ANPAGPGVVVEGGEDAAAQGPCEKCGAPLVQRRGRFGPFWGCSKYPECDFIKKKNYSIGIKCPKCAEGDVVSRRTRSRKIFYGCSRYPKCDFATWTRPGTEEAKPEAAS